MDPGEQITGTRDEHYNLISVLYHALQGAETIETYVLDAEAEGDDELVAFFRDVQATHREVARQVKERLGIAPTAEVLPEPEPVDVRGRVAPEVGFPPEGNVGPETAPETDVLPDATQPGTLDDARIEPPPMEDQEPPPPGPPRDANAPA